MNKVYIVIRGMDWEGSEIFTVHATEAGAVESAETKVDHETETNDMEYKRKGPREWRDGPSYIVIEEHEVSE